MASGAWHGKRSDHENITVVFETLTTSRVFEPVSGHLQSIEIQIPVEGSPGGLLDLIIK
jgi:hypothetical protein